MACTWRGSSGSSSTSERQRPWIGYANDCHHLPRRTQRRAELQPFGHAAPLLLRLTRSLASFSPRKAFSALSDSISRLRRECSGSGDPSLIQGHPSSSPGVWWGCRGSPSWPAFAHRSDEPAGFILSAGTSKIVTTTLPTSKSAALGTAEATASLIAGRRECCLRSPVSNASRSAPEARLVGSGTSGTPTPNIGCRELELRCPRAFGGARDERKGSQRACAALMVRTGPRQRRALFHDEISC